MRWARSAILLGAAAALILGCSLFTSLDDASGGGDAPSADGGDAGVTEGGPREPRTLRCGASTCNVDEGEVCCVRERSSAPPIVTCTRKGACFGDAGEYPAVETTCDERFDCGPDQICCATFRSQRCDANLERVVCTPVASCPLCTAASAAGGRSLCDPARTGACPDGGVCRPQSAPYTFGFCE